MACCDRNKSRLIYLFIGPIFLVFGVSRYSIHCHQQSQQQMYCLQFWHVEVHLKAKTQRLYYTFCSTPETKTQRNKDTKSTHIHTVHTHTHSTHTHANDQVVLQPVSHTLTKSSHHHTIHCITIKVTITLTVQIRDRLPLPSFSGMVSLVWLSSWLRLLTHTLTQYLHLWVHSFLF